MDIARLLKPFSGNPCGNDPLYTDTFEKIKFEIEKVSDCDYARVRDLCLQLLLNECKDLRLASYLCLALTQQNQLDGLQQGITLYQKLLERFAKDIHPLSHRARLAALSWLNHSRMPALLSKVNAIARPQKDSLLSTIDTFNKAIKNQLGPEFQPFYCLHDWLTELPFEDEELPSQPLVSSSSKATPENRAPACIDSEELAQQNLRKIIRFWQEEGEWFIACQLARTLKWSNLILPTYECTRTDLIAPRKEAIKSLDKLIQTGTPTDIIMHCESIFLEPGGHFFLDLQYQAHQAALKMCNEPLADFLISSMQWVAKLYPELMALTFSNGLPFASNPTKQWIQTFDSPKQAQPSEKPTANTLLKKAQSLSNTARLSDVLKNIEAYATQNQFDKLTITQAKVRACQTEGRNDLALIFYQQTFDKMRQRNLSIWTPKAACHFLREMFIFVQQCDVKVIEREDKKNLLQTLQQALLQLNEIT